MKKSIIFILPDLEAGGAERIVTTLANNLPRERYIPSILLLRKEGAYLDLLQTDVEIIDIATERIRHSLKPILLEIKRRKPDIVFTGFGEVNAYLALFTKLFPYTKFVARETNVVSKHVTRREIRFFYKFYNAYDRIIAQSNDMQHDLIKNFGVKKKKIIKINNPVDISFIEEKLKESVRPSAFSVQYKNVVAIGNLSARKGFDNLLKVFTRLKDQNILLHILGDGKDKEILIRMKEMLGLDHVIFHGKKSNPYQYLKYADLFILSSRYEGFPNVLLEAGTCGVYSVANDCPGGIDEIIKDQVNGEIAPIENYDAFADSILRALNNNKNNNKELIKETINSRFSKEIILQQYDHLLWNL